MFKASDHVVLALCLVWRDKTRVSALQMQVHTVEGGNHSLSVPGGKEKVETALEAALTAVCDFLDGLKLASQTQSDNPHSHNTKEGRAILTAAEDNKTGPVSGRKKRAKLA